MSALILPSKEGFFTTSFSAIHRFRRTTTLNGWQSNSHTTIPFFSISVEIESDLFDLVVIGDMCVRSNVPGDDDTGDERTWSIDVRFHVIAFRDRRLACVTDRIDYLFLNKRNYNQGLQNIRTIGYNYITTYGHYAALDKINVASFRIREGNIDSFMKFRGKSVLRRPLLSHGT